jgi:hypothetical protein
MLLVRNLRKAGTRGCCAHAVSWFKVLLFARMNSSRVVSGYTQAAWWNRIPVGAWSLMIALGICCCLLIGYGARRESGPIITFLPFLISIAFFLIADINSPRGGIIRVDPQNCRACLSHCIRIWENTRISRCSGIFACIPPCHSFQQAMLRSVFPGVQSI